MMLAAESRFLKCQSRRLRGAREIRQDVRNCHPMLSCRLSLSALCLLSTGASLSAAPPATVRFATYNASLNRTTGTGLFTDLTNPAGTGAQQVKRVAEVIQRVRPDVLLVNEFDWSTTVNAQGKTSADLFHDNFLAVGQNVSGQGVQAPLNYPYRYTARVNTGFSPSDANENGIITQGEIAAFAVDFDNNGQSVTTTGTDLYGNDCYGFGWFPGQYGMVVYSKFPIQTAKVRTFRNFLWKDMPGALLPDNSSTPPPADWYSPAELNVFRLSSKSHWDVPIDLGSGNVVHFLCAHPTPPVFDAAEDRNGKRNHDEIRFWADYIDPARANYHKDDLGVTGGLRAGDRFVIAGDHNADPVAGDSVANAARLFTQHRLINNTVVPTAAALGKTNDPTDTGDFAEDLRVDYVLPSVAGFHVTAGSGGVFWPVAPNPLTALVSGASPSDHRMVWMDMQPVPVLERAVQALDATSSGTGLSLTWTGEPGYSYAIEESPTLIPGSWTTATEVTVSVDPVTFAASAAIPMPVAATRHFYRVLVSFTP